LIPGDLQLKGAYYNQGEWKNYSTTKMATIGMGRPIEFLWHPNKVESAL